MNAAREFVSDMAEHVSMPEIYVAIRELLQNSATTIEDFVEVVERDSMLAVRVMRMAGSEYFGFPRKCENLYQAISLIGLMQLHDMMLGSLCMRSFASIPQQVFNPRSFWHYCVQCGIAARTIGRHCRAEAHPVFFNLGLLHEIGHGAIFLKEPEASLRVLEQDRQDELEMIAAERELLGFDYTEVGAELTRLWQLPPIYQQATAHHLHPERADNGYRSAVEVVHLAHVICQDPKPGRHAGQIERGIAEVPDFARLPSNIDEIIIDEIENHADDVLGLLWPGGLQGAAERRGAQRHG